ncbi:MAG: hypothetical protein HXX09_10725 [Bacteroidetes bacterium]|nr:hypothetical protein [Bacteroidota bacterium]
MVRGLDIFKKYFEQFPDNYVIIGGTACDIIIEEAALIPRATKDIDIILVVEALNADFVKQFWQFIKDGYYKKREKSADERKYYRFMKPINEDFPFQIELFSRIPDLIELEEPAYLTPIPVDDDLSSLSAILLSDDYYNFIIKHSIVENGIHLAKTEALICLKAKAYLEIAERISQGTGEDSKQLRKHKTDIFRLAVMLMDEEIHELPISIHNHLQEFAKTISHDLPNKAIYKEMGLGNLDVENVFYQLLKNFKLKI